MRSKEKGLLPVEGGYGRSGGRTTWTGGCVVRHPEGTRGSTLVRGGERRRMSELETEGEKEKEPNYRPILGGRRQTLSTAPSGQTP